MVLSEYEEKGKRIKVGRFDAYCSCKDDDKVEAGLIVIPDIFGIESGRHRAICDSLAEALPGLLVLMPDVFEGSPAISSQPGVCEGFNIGTVIRFLYILLSGGFTQLQADTSWDKLQKELYIDTSIPYLRERGAAKIAVLGFCFGSYGVYRCSASGEIAAGITFHPSLSMVCPKNGEDEFEIVRAIKCPQMLVHTKGDSKDWLPGAKAHKTADSVVPGNKWMNTTLRHGFMSRGDAHDPATCAAIAKYFEQMKGFLCEHVMTAQKAEIKK